MGKKTKWTIPFAILALACGIAAGTLAGCGESDSSTSVPHVHAYTEWRHDETQHWKVCPDDGAAAAKEPHVFIGGACECGATETAAAADGTAKGNVRLQRRGETDTDYTGITVDVGDDGVEVSFDAQTGAFTLENLVLEKEYTLRISKADYQEFSTTIVAEEGEKSIELGACVLSYLPFNIFTGWDIAQHDFTHVNDADDPYIEITESKRTLNVLSKDGYEDVSASLFVKESNSLQEWHVQGIILKFENGKHVIVRINMNDRQVIEFKTEEWPENGGFAAKNFVPLEGVENWSWGEKTLHTLTAEEMALWQGGGIDFNLTLKDGALYVFLGGKLVNTVELPDGYDALKAQVGYYCYEGAANSQWHYDISRQFPKYDVAVSEDITGGTVRVSESSPELGDEVTVTVVPDEGYVVKTFRVNGKNVSLDFDDATQTYSYTFTAAGDVEIAAAFAADTAVSLAGVTVKAHTYANHFAVRLPGQIILQGTAQKYTLTVKSDGSIDQIKDNADAAVTEVAAGEYTLQADGFLDSTLVLEKGMTEIVLESLSMDTMQFSKDWGNNVDYSQVNNGAFTTAPESDMVANHTLNKYGVRTAVSLKLNIAAGNKTGIWFLFEKEGGGYIAAAVTATRNGENVKIEFDQTDFWIAQSGIDVVTKNVHPLADAYGWQLVDNFGQSIYQNLAVTEETELTFVREGKYFYVFVNGVYTGNWCEIDAAYAEQAAYVGFVGENTVAGIEWKYAIETDEETEDYLAQTQGAVTVTGIDGIVGGSVTVSENPTVKTEMTLTFAANAGYTLASATVDGADVTDRIGNGTLTFIPYANRVRVTASFAELKRVSLDGVTVSVNAYLESLEGKLPGTITMRGMSKVYVLTVDSNGRIASIKDETGATVTTVVAGEYALSADGFFGRTITVEENMTQMELEYDGFSHFMPWDHEQHDMTHVNAADPYFSLTENKKTLNVMSKDSFGNVSASMRVRDSNSLSDWRIQGMVLKFANGRHIIVRINMNGRQALEFKTEEWPNESGFSADKFVPLDGMADWAWGEHTIHNLSEEEMALWRGDGVEFNLTLKDGVLYVFLNGAQVGSYALPDEYAAQKVQIGYYCYDGVAGAQYRFRISQDVSHVAA